MPSEAEMQALLDKQAIYEVLCKYARAADRLDAALMKSCLHEDARFYSPYGEKQGAQDLVDSAMEYLGTMDGTMHALANHLVLELKGDVAVCETYINSHHWGTPRTERGKNFVSGTRYVDRFERRNGEWRIAERWLLRSFAHYRTDPALIEAPDEINKWPVSHRDGKDRSYTMKAR